MKKFFATLLTIVVSCSFAGNIVYDYKASIKRLEPVYSVKKINKASYVTDAYKTTSDTIVGYIVVPACATCVELGDAVYTEGTYEEWDEISETVGYFIRKGDKLSKKLDYPFIAKTTVYPSSAMFGAYTPMDDNNGAVIPGKPYADVKANKYAWMALDFVIPAKPVVEDDEYLYHSIDSKYALKKYPGTPVPYGFLGFDNQGAVLVENAGFGTVKVLSFSEAATMGFCNSTPGYDWSCQMVYSISGSTVGDADYQGPCGVTPMWDVCFDINEFDPETNDFVVNESTIHGTWTLKYNKALTNVADEQKEEAILKKLGATKAIHVYEASEEEEEDEEEPTIE